MTERRAASPIRALADAGLELCLTVVIQLLLFPGFGLQPALGQSLRQGLSFAAVTLLWGHAGRPRRVRLRTRLA